MVKIKNHNMNKNENYKHSHITEKVINLCNQLMENNRRDHRENDTQRTAENLSAKEFSGSLRKISANSAVKLYLLNFSNHFIKI